MSAGPAPENPGSPRSSTQIRKPPNPGRLGARFLLGGVAVGVAYALYATRSPKPTGTPTVNPLRTPGVQNIEGAYQKGGATSTHTKAYGGTPQGTTEDVLRPGAGTGAPKGMDEDGIGTDQRPDQQGKPADKFKEMAYGSSTGK